MSNTYTLENELQWTGTLAEPDVQWFDSLKKNRPKANIITKCVWKKSGEILKFIDAEGLSTISLYNNKDMYQNIRNGKKEFNVETITLHEMLVKHNAPKRIDYLSIDTEGSEFDILKAHDFSKYTFDVITCEHNYTSNRKKIYDLLTEKGYKRKYENLSLVDDWYVRG